MRFYKGNSNIFKYINLKVKIVRFLQKNKFIFKNIILGCFWRVGTLIF